MYSNDLLRVFYAYSKLQLPSSRRFIAHLPFVHCWYLAAFNLSKYNLFNKNMFGILCVYVCVCELDICLLRPCTWPVCVFFLIRVVVTSVVSMFVAPMLNFVVRVIVPDDALVLV